MNRSVSVVVTTYNHERFIGEALASVFAQSYAPFEVIVIDDGSTDKTAQVLQPFLSRIRYIRQENQGVAGSRNAGMRHASGEYVALLDGDDRWEPDKLAVQLHAAEEHPDAGAIVVDGVKFDGDTVLLSSLFNAGLKSPEMLNPHWVDNVLGAPEETVVTRQCYELLIYGNFITTTSQVLIPRGILDVVGLSDPAFSFGSDYDLYLRIAARYPITFVKRPLVGWRYLASSASGPIERRAFRYVAEDIRILKKHRRLARQEYKALIARMIKDKIYWLAQALYVYGRNKDRTWAAHRMRTLLSSNLRRAPVILAFMIGLRFPERFASTLGPMVRRAVGFHLR